MAPQKPQVSWDGKLLTITAQNSTLADILTEVRTLTGADLDIPPSASKERMAAELGPGPAREVLSALLVGTSFDYVIQASDTDPAGVHSVLLTPRGKSETMLARNSPGGFAENPSGPPYRANARQNPVSEEVPALDATSAQSESAAETPAASSQPAAPSQQTSTTTTQAALSDVPATSADAQATPPDLTSPTPPINGSANQAPLSESQQRVQQMQNLYEQRKQMIEEARKPPAN